MKLNMRSLFMVGVAVVTMMICVLSCSLAPDSNMFTVVEDTSIVSVYSGSHRLGDIDGDNDLDLILTGDSSVGYVSKIYQNDGTGSFTEVQSGSLTEVKYSSIDLGDIDGDGDIDLILTGKGIDVDYVSKIYQNNGNGSFTEINTNSLMGVSGGSIKLGDVDGDNDLDLVLTGYSAGGAVSKIYINNGSGSFIEINTNSLMGVSSGSIDLGDIDGDSDLDLILTGGDTSKIYINDGSGSFTEINVGSIIGVWYGSIDLGDIDGDSDLDLILTGGDASKIYKNDGSGSFTEINAGSLMGVSSSSIKLGDIDGDGDIDLILAGSGVSKIYKNDGNGSFTEISPDPLPIFDSIDLGDIDGDGDIDVILGGSGASSQIIYKNNTK